MRIQTILKNSIEEILLADEIAAGKIGMEIIERLMEDKGCDGEDEKREKSFTHHTNNSQMKDSYIFFHP